MADRNSEILLESGTNEIEIMEFTVAGNLYGINVAKVDEIMLCQPVKAMPHTHPAVEGIFKPRETVITVLNLPTYLGFESDLQEKDLFIITNFNRMHIAFRVHTVIGISRISWTAIQKPDKAISGTGDSIATGIAQANGQLVTILDFEKIVAEIAPESTVNPNAIEKMGPRSKHDMPILLAEDSILLAKMITESLNKAGYVNLRVFPNGLEMWEFLQQAKADDKVDSVASLIITDIEMPQMDGHRLTKLVKDDPALQHIPLIIFSSLITEEMRIKGKQLGANEQMSKPEIGHLVAVMDHLLGVEEPGTR